MKKIAFAFVAAATFAVVPAFAQDDAAAGGGATATTTTSTSTAAPSAGGDMAGGKEFGNPGVINFAAATNLNLAFTSSKPPQGDSGSSSDIGVQPSIDYFVAEGISVGALLLIDLHSEKTPPATDSTKTTTFGIGPRVGYNLWLTPGSLSLWPTVGFIYKSISVSPPGGGSSESFSKGTLDVFVPLLIHPVKHFHLAVGPFVDLDVISKQPDPTNPSNSTDGVKDTTFGIRGEIAGWL